MNAQEIYDIVKDVPREAWPTYHSGELGHMTIRFMSNLFWPGNGTRQEWWYIHPVKSSPESVVPDDQVELLFIGSMTKWLIGEGYHGWEWNSGETDAIDPSLEIDALGTFNGKSVLAILAAACRAADGGG